MTRHTTRSGRVYPRVCGGTARADVQEWRGWGLSPRVRGNPLFPCLSRRARGSIPACAGEPSGYHDPHDHAGVYPRVCGGTSRLHTEVETEQGLSPRVRGNPTPYGLRETHSGSIPACAGEPKIGVSTTTDARVYPRVCGGTAKWHAWHMARRGLSPRVRGNQDFWRWGGDVGGVYPRVCGGNPVALQEPRHRRGSYPRVCGGTADRMPSACLTRGLSPRVRGNHVSGKPVELVLGSIPACAGEPVLHAKPSAFERVYPRVCGGTSASAPTASVRPGLSPRVRGNLGIGVCGDLPNGSIPACAGEPPSDSSTERVKRVYPRVCGGTVNVELLETVEEGLSPRVRGNPSHSVVRVDRRGSIPACAGEPLLNGSAGNKATVYPRVCGGTGDRGMEYLNVKGLSPRVRGNPEYGCRLSGMDGSIPACAGEPTSSKLRGSPMRVYPRVCGGTLFARTAQSTSQGLSPRVRGNLCPARWWGRHGGSIPACAGNQGRLFL